MCIYIYIYIYIYTCRMLLLAPAPAPSCGAVPRGQIPKRRVLIAEGLDVFNSFAGTDLNVSAAWISDVILIQADPSMQGVEFPGS